MTERIAYDSQTDQPCTDLLEVSLQAGPILTAEQRITTSRVAKSETIDIAL